jgi:hypothetical protein
MFADIEFNRIDTDFGPASKLLGIQESESYQESEITLVVDDDILYDKHLVAAHALAHAIYQCDVVGCDQRYLIQTWEPYRFHQHAELFAEVDDINVYGFLGFSIRNSLIADLKRYYYAVNNTIPEAFFHDDAVFSGFVRNSNLNKVRMNYPPIQQVERLSIDGQQGHALREMEESSHLARLHIEEKLKSLSIPTMPETAIGIIAPSRRRYPEFACVSNTHVRNTSREISAICTYLGPNLFLLTLQMFSDEYSQNSVDIFIVTSSREHRLCVTPRSKKSSYVIETHAGLKALCFQSGVKRIFQTAPNKKITKHRLYSICSVIGNSFGVEYQFYDDNDVANFVNANGSILVRRAFDRLRPGAYKMDLFRYLALYVEGGIYLDCKIILNCPIEEFYQLRDKAEQCTLVRDQIEGYIYISMLGFYCTQSWILGYALKIVVFNVLNNHYGRDFLSITGPGIFPEIFYMRDYPAITLKNSRINDSEDWRQSGVTDSSGRWIALNSYHDYYEESNHLTSTHYSSFYQQNQVYYTDFQTQYKALSKSVFDGLSGLLWINLDRAVVRRQRMEKMLANLSIPAHRISAYDGRMPLPVSTEGRSSPYEIGCLLSHLAAIKRAQSMPGDVFLVLEDDMELSYLPVLRPSDRV